MRCIVLGSGSKGNATVVETGQTRLLIDNGFSCKEVLARLELAGIEPASLRAILLTHEHNDHVAGVGVLARRLNLPLYVNEATLHAAEEKLGALPAVVFFHAGEAFRIDEAHIHPFQVSHDTADPVGFTVSDGQYTLGYCTDTGIVTRLIRHYLASCQALVLEANHDKALLRAGPYPLALQQRVLANQGHLANDTALDLAALLAQGKLRQLILAHISEVNNRPELLRQEIKARGTALAGLAITLANQKAPAPALKVGENF